MGHPHHSRRVPGRAVVALAAVLAFVPLEGFADEPPLEPEPVAPAGATAPATDSSEDGRRSESIQVDPDAQFPPQPAPGITILSLPARVSARPARFDAVPRLGPQEAGEYFATEIPMAAEHGRRGRGHRAEFLASTPGPRSAQAAAAPAIPGGSALGSPAPLAPALSSSFDSSTTDTNVAHTGSLFIPADPSGAVGPGHAVNVVNVTVRFHQKDGTLDFDDDLAGFFAPLSPLTFTFDPKVVYDQHHGRFVMVTLEQTDTLSTDTSRIFVAVSDDSDPNGTWYVFEIDTKTFIGGADRWADYPGLAVDEEAIYVTANMFGFSGVGGFAGVRLWIIEKGAGSGGLYDGGSVSVGVFDPYAGGGIATTTQPAHMFGVAPADTGTFLVSWGGITNGIDEAVQVVRVDDPLGTPLFTQSFVDVGDIDDLFAVLPNAPQAKLAGDPTHSLETNDRRALDAVWFGDSLWMTATINPATGAADAGEATAHWWEVDTSDVGALALADQGSLLGEDIATDTYTSFPAVAVNGAGQVGFGFSGSASTLQAGAFYTTHLPATAAGGNTGSGTLRSGSAYYRRTFTCSTVSRWGDYSGMVVDPVDGCFWAYNKYAIARGLATTDCGGTTDPDEDGRWGTAFGKLCPSGACPPDLRIEGTQYTSTTTETAGGQILTDGTVSVEPSADVTFRAGQRIALADGFRVKSGGSFVAVIAACP